MVQPNNKQMDTPVAKQKVEVQVSRVEGDAGNQVETVAAVLEPVLDVGGGELVLVKPNLALPWFRPGVCTTGKVIEAVCSQLRDQGCRIALIEGDGGNGSYSAMEAFAGNGLLELENKYGVDFISLSKLPRATCVTSVGGREVRLSLPKLLVEREYDHFITLPVLKVHIFTEASYSFKNLLGCIPDPLRMYYHHMLDHCIVALWKLIKPDYSLIDGTVALDGNGPLNGEAIPMNVLIASRSGGAADRLAARIMNIPFEEIRHLVLAEREGLVPAWEEIGLSCDISTFFHHTFRVRRTVWDHMSIWVSRWQTVQRLVYHSRLTKSMYRALRSLRRGHVQNLLRKLGDEGYGRGLGPSAFFSFDQRSAPTVEV